MSTQAARDQTARSKSGEELTRLRSWFTRHSHEATKLLVAEIAAVDRAEADPQKSGGSWSTSACRHDWPRSMISRVLLRGPHVGDVSGGADGSLVSPVLWPRCL